MFFKSVDKKLKEVGFEKVSENKYGCRYCRHGDKNNYNQIVNISLKPDGELLLWSYNVDLFSSKKIGNTNIALTFYEVELFYKKMKELRRK